jgi:hypothetical protein
MNLKQQLVGLALAATFSASAWLRISANVTGHFGNVTDFDR